MNPADDLILTDVTRRYDSTLVLDGVSLTVRPGETVAIVGPSGSGKSTLLNLIGSLDRPTAGSIRLGSMDIAALEGRALAAYRAATVGFVFQEHHLLPQLTARENVLLPALALRAAGNAHKPVPASTATALLERVGLGLRADAFPAQMSGGERQRVAVARALINAPKLLLCDEPTGNLDRAAGESVVALLLELAAQQGVTVLMVTHNRDHAARFGRCLEIAEGRLREVTGAAGAPR